MTYNPEGSDPVSKKARLDNGEVNRPVMQKQQHRPSQQNGFHDKHALEAAKKKLKEQRRRLPIYFGKSQLIDEVKKAENVIIMSETGSGKTTQVPQYLLEAGLAGAKMIGCTQPRRVAAISIAERVSKEMGVALGTTVGFTVRFEDNTCQQTRIKYMTDGILLREAIMDPLLMRYGIIILDEAHERTIHTDVLFGVIKQAQAMRKMKQLARLKIVIMSATLEAEHFAQYFNNAKILYIEGRKYPIKIMNTVDPQTDYVQAALVSALQCHKELEPGYDNVHAIEFFYIINLFSFFSLRCNSLVKVHLLTNH